MAVASQVLHRCWEGLEMSWTAEELWDVDLGDAMSMQNSEFKIQKRG